VRCGYLTLATSTSPTMISGIPRANSITLFRTQSAAFSFEHQRFVDAVGHADGNELIIKLEPWPSHEG
jgi:hypothetical protein